MNTLVSGQTGTKVSGPPWPTPGALLERGRYRLLAELGRDDRCAARLWRGLDMILERDVALTLFIADPEDSAAKHHVQSALQRARRSARLVSAGAAQVLDVLEPVINSGLMVAAVVAEWTPGGDLVELVRRDLPKPSVAAGLLAPLAGAVDSAHRAGLVLGCDHPQRIRITPHGRARLAFPGAAPQIGPEDDIRGLGALLYLLLTGHWPLPQGAGTLPAAPIGRDGSAVSPSTLRPEVPVELSTLALRCLAGSTASGVHTGAAVERVLESHAVKTDYYTDMSAELTPSGDADLDQEVRQRRLRLGLSVTALLVAALLILGYAGMQLASVFADRPSDPLVVGGPPAEQPAEPQPAPAGAEPPIIPIADVAVYDVSEVGSPDNPRDVGRVIDGDPDTEWSTDSYFQQFPAYKEGLGIMLSFEQPVAVSSVLIISPSPGTVLELRGALGPDAALGETTLLGTETLRSGSTEIAVQAGPPTRHLLLWITRLSERDDRIQSRISEVGVQQQAG